MPVSSVKLVDGYNKVAGLENIVIFSTSGNATQLLTDNVRKIKLSFKHISRENEGGLKKHKNTRDWSKHDCSVVKLCCTCHI